MSGNTSPREARPSFVQMRRPQQPLPVICHLICHLPVRPHPRLHWDYCSSGLNSRERGLTASQDTSEGLILTSEKETFKGPHWPPSVTTTRVPGQISHGNETGFTNKHPTLHRAHSSRVYRPEYSHIQRRRFTGTQSKAGKEAETSVGAHSPTAKSLTQGGKTFPQNKEENAAQTQPACSLL